MAGTTKIEWTDRQWNPVSGCSRASIGCDKCYAVVMSRRLAAMGNTKYAGLVNKGHFNGQVRLCHEDLYKPLLWPGRQTCFVNSMADLFHPNVPFDYIVKVWAVMFLNPQHTFQVLTKRPSIAHRFLSDGSLGHQIYQRVSRWLDDGDQGFLGDQWNRVHDLVARRSSGCRFDFTAVDLPLKNVWLGASCETQDWLETRTRELLQCHVEKRFLSLEPLLAELKFFGDTETGLELPAFGMAWSESNCCYEQIQAPGIQWVIVGGESGQGARPIKIEWVDSIVDECRRANVDCFVKQLGSIWRREHGSTHAKGGRIKDWPKRYPREIPAMVQV